MTRQAVQRAIIAARTAAGSTISARQQGSLRLAHLLAVTVFVVCAAFHGVAYGSTASTSSEPDVVSCSEDDELDGSGRYREHSGVRPAGEHDLMGPDDSQDDARTPALPRVGLTLYFYPVPVTNRIEQALRSATYTPRTLESPALPRGPPGLRC